MDHLAKKLCAGSRQLLVLGLRSTNTTAFHFLSLSRETGILQRPGLKSSRPLAFPRKTRVGVNLFFGIRMILDFHLRGSQSVEKTPLRPLVGFKALTDCLSIMQEAPDHYTSPCVRIVEQRLLKLTNAPTYRANCKCCHAVNRML